jgi:cell division transport system permease protein
MTAMFGPAPPLHRLLPAGTLRGPTAYVVAIMIFAMMIVAAAGLAMATAASTVGQAIDNRYVIQLPNADPQRLAAALDTARSTPGVTAIRPVPEEEMRGTLREWLGSAADDQSLPVPALIHLELADAGHASALDGSIASAVPGARLTAERASLGPLLRSIRLLQWLALSLVVLMAGATAAAVVLSARGALDTHRATIDVVHGMGATDRQIASLFQRKIALDAVAGAALGGLAAAMILGLLGGGTAALGGALGGRAPLGWVDLLILALMPVAAVALATLVARFAVLGALRRAI